MIISEFVKAKISSQLSADEDDTIDIHKDEENVEVDSDSEPELESDQYASADE